MAFDMPIILEAGKDNQTVHVRLYPEKGAVGFEIWTREEDLRIRGRCVGITTVGNR